MIYYILTRPYQFTLENVQASRIRPQVRVLFYHKILRQRHFRRGTYIFTDIDRLDYRDREEAAWLYRFLKKEGCRVLNDPAMVEMRLPLLRALHREGLNDFSAHRATELPDTLQFPVFVRSRYEHGRPISDLLTTLSEVRQAIVNAVSEGVPAEHLIVVEYAAEEVRPGFFRKLSAFRIGDRIIPHTTVHQENWIVKIGTMGIGTEEDYAYETTLHETNPYREVLARAFQIAGIEYGRVDFGICNGRVQIYEINTNPHVTHPKPHPSPIRMLSQSWVWENYLDGVLAVDSPSGAIETAYQRHKPVWFPERFYQAWFRKSKAWIKLKWKSWKKAYNQKRKKRAKKKQRDRERRANRPHRQA